MRTIDGYVFIANFKIGSSAIMGKNVNLENSCRESFQTNGLIPYASRAEAKTPLKDFKKKTKPSASYIAKVHMEIAETVEELDIFSKKSRLVVIMKDYDGISQTDKLLGPVMPGKEHLYPIPGARLIDNDFTAYTTENSKGNGWTPFERAEYLLKEVNRQAGCAATIATFELRKVKSKSQKVHCKSGV